MLVVMFLGLWLVGTDVKRGETLPDKSEEFIKCNSLE